MFVVVQVALASFLAVTPVNQSVIIESVFGHVLSVVFAKVSGENYHYVYVDDVDLVQNEVPKCYI